MFSICTWFVAIVEGQEPAYQAVIGNDGVQRAEVLAGSYFFKPGHIIVRADIPVELKIRKEPEITPHSFVLRAPDAGIDVHESLSSDPKVIRFTPTRAGRYVFYCDKKLFFFKGHRDKGMEGVLEVVE